MATKKVKEVVNEVAVETNDEVKAAEAEAITPEIAPEEPKEKTKKKEETEAAPTPADEAVMEDAGNEDDGTTVDKEIAKKTSRFAFELERASKNAKKEMYRSEHVITEFGDEEIVTESTKLKEDYLELVASAKSNKILKGKITGYRYAGEVRKSTILVDVEYGTGLFSVLIPSYLLYDYEISKYVEPDKITAIENHIVRMIGSEIKFIVRHVEEKNRIAYADRLAAQSILGVSNYVKPTREGRPRIFEGLIVKSQIIMVAIKGVIVDALGCDITIPNAELSHSFIGDARQEFSVGDYVNVKIGKVTEEVVEKNETNYRLIKAEGSVKAATPNRKSLLLSQFKENSIHAAEVTYLTENGVFCRLKGGVDIMVALPKFGKNPKRGESRLVRITGVDEESQYVYGIFVNN